MARGHLEDGLRERWKWGCTILKNDMHHGAAGLSERLIAYGAPFVSGLIFNDK